MAEYSCGGICGFWMEKVKIKVNVAKIEIFHKRWGMGAMRFCPTEVRSTEGGRGLPRRNSAGSET